MFVLALALHSCMSKEDKERKHAMEDYLQQKYRHDYVNANVHSVKFLPLKKKSTDGKTVYKVTFTVSGTDYSAGKAKRVHSERERYLKEIGKNQFTIILLEYELKELLDAEKR